MSTLAFSGNRRGSRLGPGVSFSEKKLGGVHVQVRHAAHTLPPSSDPRTQMETFASVAEEDPVDKGFMPYDGSSKTLTPESLDVEAQEASPDFFKRSNAEYYSAT